MFNTGSSGKPDIMFFMLDQIAAKWLEGGDALPVSTPNLDRLRSMGTTFNHAITSNPVCCPARATIATGLSSRGHGVLKNGYCLNEKLPTFMHSLQSHGWKTAAVGKLHFQPHYKGFRYDLNQYGYDIVHNTEDGRGGEWLDWIKDNHSEYYEAALATIWTPDIPEFKDYGSDGEDLCTRIKNIRSSFKWGKGTPYEACPDYHPLPLPKELSQTEWITKHAVDIIKTTPLNQPLHTFISYVQPHDPFCPPEEYMSLIDLESIPKPVEPTWPSDENHPKCFDELSMVQTKIPENWDLIRQYFYADIIHLDDQLGTVLDALESSGRLDKTYIFFLADHGEMLFDHGIRSKGPYHYDACIRVPLILTGPGIQKGNVCNEIVQLEDIAPTIFDIADITPPELKIFQERETPFGTSLRQNLPALPGTSLFQICKEGATTKGREYAYSESFNNMFSTSPSAWARTIRNSKYRFTIYPNGSGIQLFDLQNDPDETINLADDPSMKNIRDELNEQLRDIIILQDYPNTPRDLFFHGVH